MENIFFDKRDLKHCGEGVIIGKTVRIRRPELVSIGDHVIIDDFAYIPCALEIGHYTHISASCSMVGGGGFIKIGSFVDIAPACNLVTSSNDYRGGGLVNPCIPPEYAGEVVTAPVILEDFVLLGCNTTVLPGTVLPEGLSAGAYTLLKGGGYEPWRLYAGIPARDMGARDGKRMKMDAARLIGRVEGAD